MNGEGVAKQRHGGQPLELDAVAFHHRRLFEMKQYDTAVAHLAAQKHVDLKEASSHQRLLRQPAAYQVLVVIWAASPFARGEPAVSGSSWRQITVYRLVREMAPDASKWGKLTNYVARVIDAAIAFGLVRLEADISSRKNLLLATKILDDLMVATARMSDLDWKIR